MFTNTTVNIQSENETKICRLCLRTKSDSFEELMGIKRYMLEFLVADINIDISTDPKTCGNCSKNILTSYEFKSLCLENSVITEGIANLELLSKIIDPGLKSAFTIKEEVFRKCYFCHSKLGILDKLNSERDAFLKTMLDKCLPELDNHASITPCKKCMDTLGTFFAFFNYCLNTETKIGNYCKIRRLNSHKQIDLYDVIKFVQDSSINIHHGSSSALKNPQSKVTVSIPYISALKQSSEYMDGRWADAKIQIKQELGVFEQTEAVESFNYDSDDGNVFMKDCEVDNFAGKTEEIDIGEYEMIESKHEIETEEPTKDISCTIGHRGHFLAKHKKDTHETTCIYKCDTCSYITTTKRYLKLHMFRHRDLSTLPTLRCTQCSFETKRRRYLQKHRTNRHGNPADVVM